MELALNLLWLAISAGAITYWLRLPTHHRSDTSPLRSLGVLACVLVMLFVPISITDDLQAARDALEDIALSMRVMHAAQLAHASALTTRLPAIETNSLTVVEWLSEKNEISSHLSAESTPTGWRAPPLD